MKTKNLKYYVLGKKNSSLLKKYLEKYYQKLLGYLKILRKHNLLSKEIQQLLNIENRSFILNPDISSIINRLFLWKIKNQNLGLGDYGIYEQILKKEIKLFLNGKYSKLNINKGIKIENTDIRLTIQDNNPYNTQEAHPEHHITGGMIGWGEKTEQEWLRVYSKTFAILKQLDEGIYYELNQIIHKIIPLGTSKGLHNSASYKECIGHLYMGYTIDSNRPEINNLEALIHESSHNKLNLIMHFDPIILNNKQEKYYSAIRPDPRHIHGVFLGYHAFAPTMYILMQAYKNGYLGKNNHWLEKIVLFYIKTKILQKVIKKYAKLTPLGKAISQEIDYIISKMDFGIQGLNIQEKLMEKVKIAQKKHFIEVNKNYPFLEY